jgi:alpha-L-rhamnosidase
VVLGIVPEAEHPGFEVFEIKPHPGGTLSHAAGSYDSARGRIEVRWRREKGRYELHAVVPPCSTARVWVRTDEPAEVAVDSASGADRLEEREGFAVYRVAPGAHRFSAPLGLVGKGR